MAKTQRWGSQVDPLPEFPGGPVALDPPIKPVDGDNLADLFDPLGNFATTIGYTVAVEAITGSALGYCTPQRNHIGVETVSERFSSNAPVAVTIHELAHALVRVDRREGDPDLACGSEEVVVECVAYTVCSTVGLDTADWSVPYMATWGTGGDIARYGELIDRLARRLEDAAIGGAPFAGEAIKAAA